ncbi:MAG TPA: hypothetical protein P5255_08255 [Phycisphaerae bacterium]|nr:hypothetical protein [Phycisphaerae bacterium]
MLALLFQFFALLDDLGVGEAHAVFDVPFALANARDALAQVLAVGGAQLEERVLTMPDAVGLFGQFALGLRQRCFAIQEARLELLQMFGAGGQLEGLSVQRGAALAQAFLRLNPTGRRALAVLALQEAELTLQVAFAFAEGELARHELLHARPDLPDERLDGVAVVQRCGAHGKLLDAVASKLWGLARLRTAGPTRPWNRALLVR